MAVEAEATQRALMNEGVSTFGLNLEKLDAWTMGFLFMTFELLVGVLGEAHKINAYDQPGVESGKIILKEKLKQGLAT